MPLVLYQFPISHFCEKVRWALDFKGLHYKTKNLMPGPHVKVTTKLAARSSVPVLEHDGKFIQGSTKIITYLDERFPDKRLTPVNSQEAQSVLEWERYLDGEVGIHVRRYLYHTLLKHRRLTIGFLATGGPFGAKLFLWLIYPTLVKKMRKYMEINPTTAEQSKLHITKALKRINDSLVDKKFLTGDRFSRADLAACSLLAPLFMPAKYGLRWPDQLPEPLHTEIETMQPQLQWAQTIYSQYR